MGLTEDTPTDAPDIAEKSVVPSLDGAATPLDELFIQVRAIGLLYDDPRPHGSDRGARVMGSKLGGSGLHECEHILKVCGSKNIKGVSSLMGSKCVARCWGYLRLESLLLWANVGNPMASPVSIASRLVDRERR